MAICPFTTWRPVVNETPGGMIAQPIGVVPHVQVGTGSLFDRFNDPSVEASAHFWVSKLGAAEQYVDAADKAWAQEAGNPFYWSIEFEGMPDEAMTPAQLDTGGRICAWLHDLSPFVLHDSDDPIAGGFVPHYAGGADWGGHSCPGPGPRRGQYPDLILATLRYLDEHPAPDPEDDDMAPPKLYWNGNEYNDDTTTIDAVAADLVPHNLGTGAVAKQLAQQIMDDFGAEFPKPDAHGLIAALRKH